MRKFLVLFCILMFMVSLCGCGEWVGTKGDVATSKTIPSIADNPMINEFDGQLGEISDEASAERAVNTFVDYVDSRVDQSSSIASIQSLVSIVSPDTVKTIADKELAARTSGGMSVLSDISAPNIPIDIGAVTDNINILGSTEGVWVDDEIVMIVKNVIEESMPNMNSDGNDGMTPLEALVLAYTVVSGDDGTAAEGSIEIPVDKMNVFAETISN
ncbi:hypothetical protein ACFLZ2_00625 [Candidatus Margulisiibacteriota bacterium]